MAGATGPDVRRDPPVFPGQECHALAASYQWHSGSHTCSQGCRRAKAIPWCFQTPELLTCGAKAYERRCFRRVRSERACKNGRRESWPTRLMHRTKVRQFQEALVAFTRRDLSFCALLMSGSLGSARFRGLRKRVHSLGSNAVGILRNTEEWRGID
jgi:hypothetical protein